MAVKTLSASGVEAVLICQHRDAHENFVWLEHAKRNQAARHGRTAPMTLAPEVCTKVSPAWEIEFLGGFYRFPLPPCQVWSVHLQESAPRLPTIAKELLTLARIAPGDSTILGLSLYRAGGLLAGLFGFIALTPGRHPSAVLAARRGDPTPDFLERASWRALQVRWTGGHIDAAASSMTISSSRYPRAAFWARSHAASGTRLVPMPHRSPANHGREADG